MPILTPKELRERRQKRANARFAKLSRNEQRVAIAKDVLKQIKAQSYIPSYGKYLDAPLGKHPEPFTFSASLEEPINLQNIIPTRCSVCAIGALFVSMVRVGNNVSSDAGSIYTDYGRKNKKVVHLSPTVLFNTLSDYFSFDELRAMESLFEGWESRVVIPQKNAAAYRKVANSTPAARLKFIMQHIMDNDGMFFLARRR